MRKPALILEILVAYVAARRAMRKPPLPEALARLRGAPAGAAGDGVDIGQRLANPILRVLSPLPVDSRCLVRSLVMTRLLSRRGVPSSLIIGVSTEDGFQAHAWVEVDGKPVLPTLGFQPLTTL